MATWSDLQFAFEEVLTASKMNNLDENFDALAEGAAGAPAIQTAALAGSAVTTAKIKDGAVTEEKIATGATIAPESSQSASGATVDFTGLPSGMNRITVVLDGVSLNGGEDLEVQLGDSDGLEKSGYNSASMGISAGGTNASNSSTGFVIRLSSSGSSISAVMTIVRQTGNTWVETHNGKRSDTSLIFTGAGSKSTSKTVDRIRVQDTGSDSFDAGTINVLVE